MNVTTEMFYPGAHLDDVLAMVYDREFRVAVCKATKTIVVLILLISVGLMLIVTIGGWSKLQGLKPINFAWCAIYLIIATYPFRGALQALKGLASQPKLTIPRGGIAVVDGKDPKSVHLAYPGINDQVEVYDPSPARSLAVAKSGTVRPVPPPA